MAKVEGSLWKIGYNEMKDGTKLYYIQLSNEQYYNMGRTEPKAKEGTIVSFEYETKPDRSGTERNYYLGGWTRIGAGSPPPTGGNSRGGGSKPSYNKSGGSGAKSGWTPPSMGIQCAIARSSSYNTAVEMLKLASEYKAIPFKITGAANESKLEDFMALVKKVADDLALENLEAYLIGDAEGVKAYATSLQADAQESLPDDPEEVEDNDYQEKDAGGYDDGYLDDD